MSRGFLGLCLLSLIALRTNGAEPSQTVTLSKIYDDGRYNCFTDLAEFRGHYYCTFRNAISHGDPDSGVIGEIIVIRSKDLREWEPVAKFQIDTVDLRDPKLTVGPDQLRVYAVAGQNSAAGILQYHTVSARTSDGREWSKLDSMTPGYIFWRPKWQAGKYYVPAYLRRPGYCSVDLLVSEDGADWRLHSTPLPPAEVDGEILWANECDLLFLPEGKSMLFSRRNQGGGPTHPKNEKLGGFRRGYVGLAEAPAMSSWKSVNEDLYFHAPATLFHQGKIYLAGRDMVPLENGATETCRLWSFDPKSGFTEIAQFLTKGDCSYPGLIAVSELELAVSYYSCHEGTTAYFAEPGKCDIYLARVSLRK